MFRKNPARVARKAPPVRPVLEPLEDRCLPSVYTVTNTLDSGTGSFRQAIKNANANPGADTIDFDIPTGIGVVKTITVKSPLPTILDAVTINASTQDGWGASNSGWLEKPVVMLVNGDTVDTDINGLTIRADNSTVRGLDIENFKTDGIAVFSNSNIIIGNLIQHNNLAGIELAGGASNNTIGGLTSQARNVVANFSISSGDSYGIRIAGMGTQHNVVLGNFLGTNVSGTAVAGVNDIGVEIRDGATDNTVGDTTPGGRNIISGDRIGVIITGPDTTGNTLEGNFIGTDITGTRAVANARYGVDVSAPGNTIGGTAPGAGNVISGNGTATFAPYLSTAGVFIDGSTYSTAGTVVEGNFIGTDRYGTKALGNGGDGILLENAGGVTIGGGIDAVPSNVISGNQYDGVAILAEGTDNVSDNNYIMGNYIGADKTGTIALPNVHQGVEIAGLARGNHVYFNRITGSGGQGVEVGNTFFSTTLVLGTPSGNVIESNTIGSTVAGPQALSNKGFGVYLYGGASNNTVQYNVISGNGFSGVQIVGTGTTLNTVLGNYIGLDATGTVAVANRVNGVTIDLGAANNTVENNTISGNTQDGVDIIGGATNNTVQSNYIGTDYQGKVAVGNGRYGVYLFSAPSNTVQFNIISGNGSTGVVIGSFATKQNTLLDNFVGVDATGKAALANHGAGVVVTVGASNNTLRGNTISGNTLDGIDVIAGANNTLDRNFIGTDYQGKTAAGNGQNGVNLASGTTSTTLSANVISGNGYSGVVISGAKLNRLQSNLIGVDATGKVAIANQLNGVTVATGATNNQLLGNTVSGNSQAGVSVYGTDTANNTVAGNFIGTDSQGATAVGNGSDGVEVFSGATGTILNGNVISGNTRYGVWILNAGTDKTEVSDNAIGTDLGHLHALGNGSVGLIVSDGATNVNVFQNFLGGNGLSGVNIEGAATHGVTLRQNFIGVANDLVTPLPNGTYGVAIFGGAHDNAILGVDQNGHAAANIIANNPNGGVLVQDGKSNLVSRNSIYNNGGPGIILSNGNGNIPSPVVLSATQSGDTVTITGNFHVANAPGPIIIELFAGPGGPNGGGRYLLASLMLPANGNFSVQVSAALFADQQYVVGTATDGKNNTSAFSSPILVTGNSPVH